AGLVLPDLMPVGGVHCIDIAVVTAEKNDMAGKDGERHDPVAGGEFPLDAMKLTRPLAAIDAGMCGVAAEHRLRIDGARRARARERESKDGGFHDAPPAPRRSVSGSSSGPSSKVPRISRLSLSTRPSKATWFGDDSMRREFPSCITRSTGMLFVCLPTMMSFAVAPAPAGFSSIPVPCRGEPPSSNSPTHWASSSRAIGVLRGGASTCDGPTLVSANLVVLPAWRISPVIRSPANAALNVAGPYGGAPSALGSSKATLESLTTMFVSGAPLTPNPGMV